MRCRCWPVEVVILNDCFIRPSGLYRYPSGPSSSPSPRSSSLPRAESGVFPALVDCVETLVPPRFPSISRYVRKLPETRLALHDFPSVQRRIPASRSSQTNTEPDWISWRSFSESRRWTRGSRPMRHASKRIMASAGVRTWP